MNDSKIEVRGMSYREALHNPTINETPPEESGSKLKETEMERSETPRWRIVGKRTVEEDAHVHAKKERSALSALI